MLAAKEHMNQDIHLDRYIGKINQLSHMLNVLFHFVKKEIPVMPGMLTFRKDVESWIFQIAGSLHYCRHQPSNRKVLLHLLRTPGIGGWGATLLHFPLPSSFTTDYLDNFLVCLQAFLGPIEEMEDILGPKRTEFAMVRENMYKMEHNQQWVVIEDSIFDVPPPAIQSSILLLQSDYMSLLRQFNAIEVLRFFLRYYFAKVNSMNEPFSSQVVGNILMTGISLAHAIFKIFARSFHVIPRSYEELRRAVASQIVLVNQLFAESLSLIPVQLHSAQLCYSVPNLTIKYTSLQAELESFIYRSLQVLLSKEVTGNGDYAILLPIDSISGPASIRVLDDLLSGTIFLGILKNDSQEPNRDFLIQALLRKGKSDYFFLLLQKLITTGGNISSLIGNQIINTCFAICLSNSDFQKELFPMVRETLAILCSHSAFLIGFVLQRTMESFSIMENIAIDLFCALPLSKWIPEPVDLIIIENMLKDPIGSSKSNLACEILDQIDWQNPLIKYECLKVLGLALVNIHLDLLGRDLNPGGIIQGTAAVVQSSAVYFLRGPLKYSHQSFSSWTW